MKEAFACKFNNPLNSMHTNQLNNPTLSINQNNQTHLNNNTSSYSNGNQLSLLPIDLPKKEACLDNSSQFTKTDLHHLANETFV